MAGYTSGAPTLTNINIDARQISQWLNNATYGVGSPWMPWQLPVEPDEDSVNVLLTDNTEELLSTSWGLSVDFQLSFPMLLTVIPYLEIEIPVAGDRVLSSWVTLYAIVDDYELELETGQVSKCTTAGTFACVPATFSMVANANYRLALRCQLSGTTGEYTLVPDNSKVLLLATPSHVP